MTFNIDPSFVAPNLRSCNPLSRFKTFRIWLASWRVSIDNLSSFGYALKLGMQSISFPAKFFKLKYKMLTKQVSSSNTHWKRVSNECKTEYLHRVNLELVRSSLYWDSKSLGVASMVVNVLFLSNMKYNDNKCKKTLQDIFENYSGWEVK